MSADERGLDSTPSSTEELSLDELRGAYRSLLLEYSKQSSVLRLLKIENRELRNIADEKRIPVSAVEKIRNEVLSLYLQNLPRPSRRRGPPTNTAETARAVEMWAAYSAIAEPKPPFKSWLRSQIESSYKTFPGVSLGARKTEIERLVSKIAARISRLKNGVT